MISSDHNKDHLKENEESKKNSPVPETYRATENTSDVRVNGEQKGKTIFNERSDLNANQEQRPDSKNPERNRDK
jgi:hypothetical protein